MFVDGVQFRVWASNPVQARIIGKLRRQADGLVPVYISYVVVEQ